MDDTLISPAIAEALNGTKHTGADFWTTQWRGRDGRPLTHDTVPSRESKPANMGPQTKGREGGNRWEQSAAPKLSRNRLQSAAAAQAEWNGKQTTAIKATMIGAHGSGVFGAHARGRSGSLAQAHHTRHTLAHAALFTVFAGTRTPKCRWLNLVNSDIPSLVTLVGHMGPRAALSGRAGGFSCFCEEPRTVRHTTHNTCSCKLWTDAHQQTSRHLVAWQHVQAAQAYNTHCTSLADRATCSQQHSKA